MKIIDAHAHIIQTIAGTGSQGELRGIGNGQAIYASGQVLQMIPPELGSYDFAPEAMLAVMDTHQVEKAVLLQGNYFGFQNHYTYEAVKKYPKRFVGAATFDPFCVKKDQIIHHLFDELSFPIIKMEVSNGSGLMSYHKPLQLDGEEMEEVYSMANDRKLTFVIDMGRPGNICWQPDALRRVVLRYPDMPFVICHLFSPQLQDGELLVDTLKKFTLKNVWFDLASLPSNCKPEVYPYPTAQHFARLAADIVGADRLMWGSDVPSTLCRDTYRHLADYLLESNILQDEEKEKIFFRNARKVYFNDMD